MARLVVHFIGHRQAIEPVYTTNIREVLQLEAGHMVGLFEQILPEYGLDIRGLDGTPAVQKRLECAEDDIYLGSFAIVPGTPSRLESAVDFYIQSHPGAIIDLPAGQYRYRDGRLERISSDLVLRRHVVAINQEVYDRAGVGISAVSRRRGWDGYVDLGRALHRVQASETGLGFMSCGYSSQTGHPLPAARRLESILRSCGLPTGPSYFFIGGAVSDAQVRSEGMKEDLVHMRGPAEILRDDLAARLPHYMVPNRIVVLDELPLTAGGKVDHAELESIEVALDDRPFTAPRTRTEEWLCDIWREELRRDRVSVHDDFFAIGGNSLIAVALAHRLNKEFGTVLPVQVLFEAPTVAELSKRIDAAAVGPASRLVRLSPVGAGRPVYCWPGLGGSVMSLRLLARTASLGRPFYGVQAHGLNEDEQPYPTLAEMAAQDVREIRRLQPAGPYTLVGYSFGTRVALEATRQLERAGEQVDRLVLIAPGSPLLDADATADADNADADADPIYRDRQFVAILFSVFTASVTDAALKSCLDASRSEADFVRFISDYKGIDPGLAHRIATIVRLTYQLMPSRGPDDGLVDAPAVMLRASGDAPSFLETGSSYLRLPPNAVQLKADHYAALRPDGVSELAAAIRAAVDDTAVDGTDHLRPAA